MKKYIELSNTCSKQLVPKIVKKAVKEYENSDQNRVRSMRVLYEGGLVSSRKYTKIRNGGDVVQKGEGHKKRIPAEFMPG
jgi:hypothetical protein